MAEENETKAVKRGRGRPPKPDSEKKTKVVKNDDDGEPPVKRGRGRPKGSTKAKGRGRPKGKEAKETVKKVKDCFIKYFYSFKHDEFLVEIIVLIVRRIILHFFLEAIDFINYSYKLLLIQFYCLGLSPSMIID